MPMLTALCSQSEIVDSLGVFSEYVAQLEYSRNFLENKDDRSEEENKYLQFINSHLAGIEQLETSEDVYVIKSGKDAETIYDVENNQIVMTIPEERTMFLLAHELTHCMQYERGDISFNSNGTGGELYDITDEIEAVNAERTYYGGFYTFGKDATLNGEKALFDESMVRNMGKGVYKTLPGGKRSLNPINRIPLIFRNERFPNSREYYKGWFNDLNR